MRKEPVLLSIVGKKGSGKALFLENLISILKGSGFRLGVIKHLARDDIEIDEPGKDTFRYRMNGAETVMLAGSRRLALFSDLSEERPLQELLTYFSGYDVVFLEGYFSDALPKIEVYQPELGEPLSRSLKNVFAIYSETQTDIAAPHFNAEQLSRLAAFLEEELIAPPPYKERADCV